MKKRKKFIIYPKFQFTMVLVNLITSALCLIAVVSQTHMAFEAMRDLGIRSNMTAGQPYFQFLDLQERTFFFYLLMAFLSGAVISLVATILYSHRVAGPLVRIQRYFSEMKEMRKVPDQDLRFRKNDYCHDLAVVINDALKSIKE